MAGDLLRALHCRYLDQRLGGAERYPALLGVLLLLRQVRPSHLEEPYLPQGLRRLREVVHVLPNRDLQACIASECQRIGISMTVFISGKTKIIPNPEATAKKLVAGSHSPGPAHSMSFGVS